MPRKLVSRQGAKNAKKPLKLRTFRLVALHQRSLLLVLLRRETRVQPKPSFKISRDCQSRRGSEQSLSLTELLEGQCHPALNGIVNRLAGPASLRLPGGNCRVGVDFPHLDGTIQHGVVYAPELDSCQ